jgi:hypothetical protein
LKPNNGVFTRLFHPSGHLIIPRSFLSIRRFCFPRFSRFSGLLSFPGTGAGTEDAAIDGRTLPFYWEVSFFLTCKK